MYINEAIRRLDELSPNEYSADEKYRWCDDLNALLAAEHMKKYERVTLERGKDGDYLLPEGVTFEMVDRIVEGGREIEKYDFRTYGIRYLYGIRGRFLIPERYRVRDDVDVVYLKGAERIRNVDYEGDVLMTQSTITLSAPIRVGDTITVRTGDFEFADLPVMGTESSYDWDDVTCEVPEGTFEELFTDGDDEIETVAQVVRLVTDETLCPPPYDVMYVDYLMAQVCYYQKDMRSYNQHMNLFNQRMAALDKFIMSRKVQDRDGVMRNWW